MRTTSAIAAALLMLAALRGLAAAQEPAAPAYRVIVHPDNPLTTIDRRHLAEAFLKRTTRWPDGEQMRPVDLEPEAAARRRFSQEVLGRSVGAIKSHWHQIIFSGRGVPPPELDTDAEVVKYVLRHRGAVGYVSGGAELGGAKVLTLR